MKREKIGIQNLLLGIETKNIIINRILKQFRYLRLGIVVVF
jgi:hypothetical protein